jgi:DNA-binding IclR family transcriptional regulator
MAMTYAELHKKTVTELREIAKDLDQAAVQGFTQMNKEHLLPLICKALGVDMHAHHVTSGFDKQAVKARMRKLRAERDEALEAHDTKRLKQVRRELHVLNHRLRAHTI